MGDKANVSANDGPALSPDEPFVVARTWHSVATPRSFLDLVSLPYVVSREVREARVRRRLQLNAEDTDASAGGPHRSLDSVIDFHHRAAMERMLAGVRLVAVSVLFVALVWSTGVLHSPLAKALMGLYAAYALALFLVAWIRPESLIPRLALVHVADLGWTAVATAVSGGTSSHVFPLFTFVLAAAAYRWGLWRTLLDAGIIVVIALAQSAMALAGLTPWRFEFDWFVLWICSVFVMAVLLGMLSERQLALTFNAAAVGRVMARMTQASGLEPAVQCALAEIAQLFGSRSAVLVIEQAVSGRAFAWSAGMQRGHAVASPRRELPREERDTWLFPVPATLSTFEVQKHERGESRAWVSLGLDEQGRSVDAPLPAETALRQAGPWRSVVCATIGSAEGFAGRLYVLDPTAMGSTRLRLGLLQALVTHAIPVMRQLYLLDGLRQRVGARERARIARELHDGPIQSLVGISMRLDALRRHAETTTPALAADVAAVRDLLQEEAARMRELMEGLEPVDLDAVRLPAALRALVERFSRTSGVDATLQWNVRSLDLTPVQCGELFRVVQEALVNVRRHSAATRATVKVVADVDGWTLTVRDNGKGMGFSGRTRCDDTQPIERGPRVIRERTAALGGSLAITSQPSGTTLQITVPHGAG